MDESPILPGDLDEDSEDEFEPAPTLSTAPAMPRDPPCPSSHQDPSRENRPPAVPDLDPITPAGNSRQGAEDHRLVIHQPEKVIEIQHYATPVGLGRDREDVEMEFNPPVGEDLNSRRSRNLSASMGPAQPENDEPEPATPKGKPELWRATGRPS
jgi:hypothetical protein